MPTYKTLHCGRTAGTLRQGIPTIKSDDTTTFVLISAKWRGIKMATYPASLGIRSTVLGMHIKEHSPWLVSKVLIDLILAQKDARCTLGTLKFPRNPLGHWVLDGVLYKECVYDLPKQFSASTA